MTDIAKIKAEMFEAAEAANMTDVHPALIVDVQAHRNAAYQGGWDDGYAEGYGKAKSETDVLREAARAAVEALFPLAYGEEILSGGTAYSEAKSNARAALANLKTALGE